LTSNSPPWTTRTVSDARLEHFLLFCVFTAGKRGTTAWKALQRLLRGAPPSYSPFEYLRLLHEERKLDLGLRKSKCGQYTRIGKACRALVESRLNLRTCSTDDLEKIPGIGPKTSRFFILHSRRQQRMAVLDTHVLAFLRRQGYPAPKSTPSNPLQYAQLERAFLREANRLCLDPYTADVRVWLAGKRRNRR